MLKRWNNFINESKETKSTTFKHKSGDLIQKRIQFLSDKFLDLKDMGLDVSISKTFCDFSSPTVDNWLSSIGVFIKDYDSILDDYYSNLLKDKKEIIDIINNFKNMGITPLKVVSNGNHGCIIHFARTGHGKYTIPLKYL